ncbi:MAG TPA: LrgB family protein [Rhodoblastus sp.]|nr:LrgB family protein [Rhodoblastus sp.]
MAGWLPERIDPALHMLFWSAATVGCYLLAKRLYRIWPKWWLTPLAAAPAALIVAALMLNESYRDYIHSAGWLLALLGPATVAFAVPIYEQRALIRRHWPILLAGMLVGSATAMATSFGLAAALGLSAAVQLSLTPRSMSTPFAMQVSGEIGGLPDLTAIFVVLTGVFGAVIGEFLLARLPLRSALARGALFGVGAHGAGTAKAHQIGQVEGAVSGLVMVLVGLLNVLAAPLIAPLFR